MRIFQQRNKHSTSVWLDFSDSSGKRRYKRIGRAKTKEQINLLMGEAKRQLAVLTAQRITGTLSTHRREEPIAQAVRV